MGKMTRLIIKFGTTGNIARADGSHLCYYGTAKKQRSA